ncbi:MAG: tRNA (N6-isopentenyl adenosine(37)-C2)-methylthiotransferase MiaB [Rhodospirillales bacterium]|nr:tRNA (N6-isopentenyl adenosine(37)-C2)-methylthiotransferase MiaB [Rhodospirillales bacterium]
MAKSLFIKTYGCQMNVYDSDRMTDLLAPLCYAITDTADGADMVILNTCHIREKAAEKVFSELGRLRPLKDSKAAKGEAMILAVAGCVAQAAGEEIIARAPYVDMVFGPQTYHRLPEMVAQATRKVGSVLDTDFPTESKFDYLPKTARVENNAAFLTVQEGCDKFCTFCVVPYTRGSEFSRPVDEILVEARRMAENGAREITLLGQNVNAYHGEATGPKEWGLGRLIREIAEIDGLSRIRYSTSYPAEVDDELIAAHRDVEQLMPFLHLPIQSGSDRVLSAMNRRHNASQYRDLVERLRAVRPDIGLSSDFIVGFPGESEEDFEQTMALIREIGFIQAFSFKYSPRPGTPAAMMQPQVDEDIKTRRLAELKTLLDDQQTAFNLDCVGKTMPVLLEKMGRHEGQLVGRSPYMQLVHVEAPHDLMGTVAMLKIDSSHSNSLAATLVLDDPLIRTA